MKILLMTMAVCALLGGADRILGNRFGLGALFEEAFHMMGPLALSMTGILCLSPLLAGAAGTLAPLLRRTGADPGVLSCILAIDMGGWQMARQLSDSPEAARFFGILVTATMGCTLSFTIPAGMGMYGEADRACFSRGVLCGLAALPVGLLIGGAAMGLGLWQAVKLCLPLILPLLLLGFALVRVPGPTVRAFGAFAALLRVLATAGLALGAFRFIGGIELVPGLMPVEESLQVVCAIAVTLLGSLPAANLLQRALRRPLAALGGKLGIGADGVSGLLLFTVNVTPGLAALPGMGKRAKIVNAAFSVSAASALTAHLAFTVACAPEMAGALLAGKLAGAAVAAALALLMTSGMKDE
ncbi:MAG: ethanolamine utilization protein EutH [Clostridia bacterium]|nr:ethanolamine utilization protein EutH [Clostridia bacterium]